MFSKQRSGIPVSGKSSIPVKRTGQAAATASQTPQTNGNSGIPKATSKVNGKNSTTELPNDLKLLSEMVVNLQRQIQDREEALKELSDKLSRKSEECESLVEERDILRSKSSFDLQQVTDDYAALQETLRRKDRYIQEMEQSHREETRQLKTELEELISENDIELEMLKKEMEDLKLREERWKRVAELKKDSDYDSSDVGSRDHSPEIEALKEQMTSLQSQYEDEINVLKEKLETQIEKLKAATEKTEEQEFEYQESINELKSSFVKEKIELLAEYQTKVEGLKISYEEKLKGMETTSGSSGLVESVDLSQMKEYENQIFLLGEQVKTLERQLDERQAQMADDMLIMKNEFEKQMEDAGNAYENEKEQSRNTISELKSHANDMRDEHARNIEQMKEAFTKEKEKIESAVRNNSVLSDHQMRNKELERKITEYEKEVKQLKENLRRERNEFVEVRELLESTISDQENDFAKKEERIRNEVKEEHRKELENVISDYERQIQANENNHRNKDETVTNADDRLRQQMKQMKVEHEKELERLHNSLETLQKENEDLKAEFDLVVSDLSTELEITKKKDNCTEKRRNSLVLKEQIESMKEQQEGEVRVLSEKIELYEKSISELEAKLQRFSSESEKSDGDIDLQTKIAELQYELEILRKEKEDESPQLQNYKRKVLDLEAKLENRGVGEKQIAQTFEEEQTARVAHLEKQVDDLKEEKIQIGAELQENKDTVETLSRQVQNLETEKERMQSEVKACQVKIQSLNAEAQKYQAVQEKQSEEERQAVTKLKEEKDRLKSALKEKSQENKVKIEQLTKELEQMEAESKQALDSQKAMSGEIISKLHEKIEKLQEEDEEMQKETEMLRKEIDKLRNASNTNGAEMKNEVYYQEKVNELTAKIKDLESSCQQSEDEKQELLKEMENLRQGRNIEPEITLASVDENFAAYPSTANLEYEQQMKGLAEDYETKIQKLEIDLQEERNKSAAMTRRMESINLKTETLRENLEQERASASNSQTRLVNLQQRYEEEISSLRKQIELNAIESKKSLDEEDMKAQFSKTIKTLEADLETALQANSEQADKLTNLRTQLENALATNKTQLEEIVKLNQEREEAQQKQTEHEANLTAEQLIASKEHANTVVLLKADLEAARKMNKRQEREIEDLKHDLEEFQQQQIAHEANLTAEQVKVSETEKAQKQELKRKTREISNLKSDLEDALQTSREQSREINRLKNDYSELQVMQNNFQEKLRSEQSEEVKAKAQKIESLEEEVRKKQEEMAKLFVVLDTEQKGRERVLIETERHLTNMHQAEKEKITAQRIITELQNENETLKYDLTKGKALYDSYVSQSENKKLEDQEEVDKLSKSLTESEIDKSKLSAEVETWKDELSKMQEKYSKLKEKFLVLRQKRKEEKEKYDEALLTPRYEMGLQTSLLEPEDLNQTKEQLSSSMREQVRLEDELETLQRDIQKTKSEMQALRRANEVLRRQNQVLYLETESLKNAGYGVGVDVPRLQQQNEQLMQDKENLEIENRFLREALVGREKQEDESKEKGTLSKVDKQSLDSQLQEIKHKHAKVELENSKLIDENDFLFKQGKRLQSLVDHLENEIQSLKEDTPMMSTPSVANKSQLLISEIIQREPGAQFILESSPVPLQRENAPVNEVALFKEEHERLKEQLSVLQRLLRSKEEELHKTNSSQKELVDGLMYEKQALVVQIEAMNETLESYGKKGLQEKNGPTVTEWNSTKRMDSTNGNSFIKPGQIPFPGLHPSNIKDVDFNVDSYLGAAFWEASKFLERVHVN